MGVMSYEEAQQYEDLASYLVLPDDGDTVTVKIMISSMKDIYKYMVHSVKVEGQWKKVECVRNNLGEPVNKCPLCEADAKKQPFIKYYIPIYNLTEDKFQYWERGKSFTRKLVSLCDNYYPVCDEVFEIERVGKKGDPNTTYEIECITDEYVNKYGDKHLNFSLEDLDVADPMSEASGIVIEKTLEELQYYVEHGKFEDDSFDYEAQEKGNRGNRGREPMNRGSYKNSNNDDNDSGFRRRGSYSSRTNRDSDDEDSNEGYQSRTTRRRREF